MARSFRLHKLIRDNVLDNMLALGQKVDYKNLDDAAFLQALKAKLFEEFKEIDISSEKAFYELADLLEIIEALAKELGGDFAKLRRLQLATRQKRGGFEKRLFVETVSLKDDDRWIEYYESEPDRFPVIKEGL